MQPTVLYSVLGTKERISMRSALGEERYVGDVGLTNLCDAEEFFVEVALPGWFVVGRCEGDINVEECFNVDFEDSLGSVNDIGVKFSGLYALPLIFCSGQVFIAITSTFASLNATLEP